MDIEECNQSYGQFCLNHAKQFNGKTIDKLTFTVPKLYFRKNIFKNKEKVRNEIFYIENCNNQYFKLHLQGEYINPLSPMFQSVMEIFHFLTGCHIFLDALNIKILRTLDKRYTLDAAAINFLGFLRKNGFYFSGLELAFDFFNCIPFKEIKNGIFKKYENSYYTKDNRIFLQKIFKEDGSFSYEKRISRASIFIIYDRGKKLGVQEKVWRIEWRIRDVRSCRLLDITDLRFTMDDFIKIKGYRLRNTFNHWITPDSIIFNWDYINNHFPIFAVLTTG